MKKTGPRIPKMPTADTTRSVYVSMYGSELTALDRKVDLLWAGGIDTASRSLLVRIALEALTEEQVRAYAARLNEMVKETIEKTG